MQKQVFTIEKDGFVGAYYGGPNERIANALAAWICSLF